MASVLSSFSHSIVTSCSEGTASSMTFIGNPIKGSNIFILFSISKITLAMSAAHRSPSLKSLTCCAPTIQSWRLSSQYFFQPVKKPPWKVWKTGSTWILEEYQRRKGKTGEKEWKVWWLVKFLSCSSQPFPPCVKWLLEALFPIPGSPSLPGT